VFPVDRRVAEVVDGAVRAFEQEGAHVEEVKLGIERDQRELSDLWCRLIMPINVEAFENLKAQGIDLLGEHRDDFPPEYLRWIDEGYRLTVPEMARDQQMRTEIYDAIQGVLENHDLLVTPTLA
jgi:amidase